LQLDTLRRMIEQQHLDEGDFELLSEADTEVQVGDDAKSFRTPAATVTLSSHCKAVGELARRFACAIGLPEYLVHSLELAGLLHDLGKLDPRFQAWLCGGDELEAMREAEPLAKSKGTLQSPAQVKRARRLAGYPDGARHEALSVALAGSSLEVWAQGSSARRELVQFLIGTHHGWGRPFWPVVHDNDSPTVCHVLGPKTSWPGAPPPENQRVASQNGGVLLCSRASPGLERLDSGWTESFWRMVRSYGPWGLALLETVFILADHQRSRQEQEVGS
jgi:CRISPR-associated endonuclease/helicase Cas3